MYMEGYFLISAEIKKIEGPYSRNMVDRETGERLWVRQDMLVVAPQDYPQLAEGLEIGAFYHELVRPDGSSGLLHGLSSLEKYYGWCEQLVSLVTNGKKLKERPDDEVEWSNKLSELVEDKTKYPETEGRGPFWEMLRYALRGMTFGPVVCQKLVADFQRWEPEALALDDSDFSSMYDYIWSTFGGAGEAGMARYAWHWSEDTEPKLGIESLALLEAPEVPVYDDDGTDSVVREFDDI